MPLSAILEANKKFVKANKPEILGTAPSRHVFVLSCMDTRLVGLIEQAMGYERGEILQVKNAGNSVTDDVLRSLVGGVYQLGVEEVLVVGHTECGMCNVDTTALRDKMLAAGVSEATLDDIDLANWIDTFACEEEHVKEAVAKVKSCRLLPKELPVYGLMMDIETGELTVVSE